MGIATLPLKQGIGRLCGPNPTVVGGGYGASLGHPTQNPHPEPCCVPLARVLMTVVLRPGCASNPGACSRTRTLQFQRETVWNQRTVLSSSQVVLMGSQVWQPWQLCSHLPPSQNSVVTTPTADRLSMIQCGGGRVPESTCKVRSHAMTKFFQ